MGSLSPVHWLIVIAVVLLLFGSRKLPEMARGVGQSMRILKAETQALKDDGGSDGARETREASSGSSGSSSSASATPERSSAAERDAS